MGSKKLQVWLPLLFAIVMVAGMWIGYKLRDKAAPGSFFRNESRSDLDEVTDLIRTRYVDKVKTDSLQGAAIGRLLDNLDPHSYYMTEQRASEFAERQNGSFEGIGVEVRIFSDTLNITGVTAKGPAEKAGLRAGDQILRVDDTARLTGPGLDIGRVRAVLRGPARSRARLGILRDGRPATIVVERGPVPILSVDAAYMVTPATGFIHLNRFGETTYREFMFALETLRKKGMKELILDLRGNGGGLLRESAEIADEFLDGDKLIVYAEGEHTPRFEFRCKRDGVFEKGKLTVLVDETSASASEVLAGALQDWDRAEVIGRRTFGKGLVQQQFTLGDGSRLGLTIARYYTPLGRNIQKPYNKGRKQYEEELITRFHNGEVVTGDTAKPRSKPYRTPNGKLVYGGGGITPDVFVPFDTAARPAAVNQLYFQGILTEFVYRYFLAHRNALAAFHTPAAFRESYHPGEDEWSGLSAFAARDSVSLAGVNSAVKQELMEHFKSLLARQIWGTEGFYETNAPDDRILQRALAPASAARQ